MDIDDENEKREPGPADMDPGQLGDLEQLYKDSQVGELQEQLETTTDAMKTATAEAVERPRAETLDAQFYETKIAATKTEVAALPPVQQEALSVALAEALTGLDELTRVTTGQTSETHDDLDNREGNVRNISTKFTSEQSAEVMQRMSGYEASTTKAGDVEATVKAAVQYDATLRTNGRAYVNRLYQQAELVLIDQIGDGKDVAKITEFTAFLRNTLTDIERSSPVQGQSNELDPTRYDATADRANSQAMHDLQNMELPEAA